VLRSLLQPRYAALSLLMVVVAAICVAAGTWQISRYEQQAVANNALTRNAHSTTAPVAQVLPVYGAEPAKGRNLVEFRLITATGTYDVSHQQYVRERSDGDANGDLVLTPFRTTSGVWLLVIRGFVSNDTFKATKQHVAAPPAGQVTLNARAEPSEKASDKAAELVDNNIDSINVADQGARFGLTLYNGYANLDPGQPGSSGLTALGPPDLSNPAGGALEPQHLAYVIQWYLFAGLALAAPFAMIRSERKRVPRELGEAKAVDEPTTLEAKLADRYGRR
jgi:cytochrome oxidase assembly protein ShyY1